MNVAVLHPIRSAYFDYKREQARVGYDGIVDLDIKLQEALCTLATHGIEYHFLDETLMEKYGFAENA